MNSSLPNASHFTHLDLASGRSALVPLNFQREKQVDTLALVLQAQRANAAVTFASGMNIFVDLSCIGHGVAMVGLSAAFDLCGGRIKKDDPIYTMAVAVAPRAEDIVWNRIGAIYFGQVVSMDDHAASIGEKPGDHPWVAGFAWPCASLLGEKGKHKLVELARVAAATVVNRCRDVYVSDPSEVSQKELMDPEDGDSRFGDE